MSFASAVALELATDEASFGGKAAQLGAALRAGLPVPPGVALSWSAVEAIAADETAGDPAVADALLARLGGAVAVRSSAVGEDSAQASFAGVHETLLNVRDAASLRRAVATIHRSASAEGALAYRKARGHDATARMGVVVQRFLPAMVAGVLFTRHPVTGEDERVIEASWGLGESIVGGIVTPDHVRVTRDGVVREHRLGDKDVAIEPDAAGGTREIALPADRAAQECLDDATIRELLALADRCEALGPGPLDLEWCVAGGRVYLLQQRPMTA